MSRVCGTCGKPVADHRVERMGLAQHTTLLRSMSRKRDGHIGWLKSRVRSAERECPGFETPEPIGKRHDYAKQQNRQIGHLNRTAIGNSLREYGKARTRTLNRFRRRPIWDGQKRKARDIYHLETQVVFYEELYAAVGDDTTVDRTFKEKDLDDLRKRTENAVAERWKGNS